MAKQLMIYDRAVPVSTERHSDWSVRQDRNYSFVKEVNSVPLLAAEFLAAAPNYAIVFAGDEDNVSPSVILGINNTTNNSFFIKSKVLQEETKQVKIVPKKCLYINVKPIILI